jgi:hypothetical protein
MAQQSSVDQGLLIIEASRSHSDTPHLVGLLRKSDQPERKDHYLYNTKLTRERHPRLSAGFDPRNPSKLAAADPRFRPPLESASTLVASVNVGR